MASSEARERGLGRASVWVRLALASAALSGCDAGGPRATPEGTACGELTTACECVEGFGVDHFPGERIPALACDSGVAELASCQADCGGYPASAAVCVCDGPGPELADPAGLACGELGLRPWPGEVACLPLSARERRVVDRLTTVWHTAPSLVCRYDAGRGGDGPCGPLSAGSAFYCPVDDSLQIERRFLDEQAARFGDFAATTVLAHEWGHMQQRRLGLDRGGFDKRLELHADCQAGVFAAVERAAGRLGDRDPEIAMASLCASADPGGDSSPAATHGSCEERRAAFERGLRGANARLAELCGPNPVGVMVAVCGP